MTGGAATASSLVARGAVSGAIVASIAAVLAVVIAGSPFRDTEPGRFVPVVVLSVAGILGWALALVRPRPDHHKAVLAVSVVLVVAAASAAGSRTPSLAWPAVWLQFATLGVALLAWRVACMATSRVRLLVILVAVLQVVCLAYIADLLAHLERWLTLGLPIAQFPLRPGAGGGIAGIPTWMADYLILLAPVAAGVAWGDSRARRVAAVGVIVFAGLLLVMTGTRSVWLIAGGMLVLAAVIALMRHPSRMRAVGVVAGTLVGATFALATDLPARVARDADAGRSSAFASAVDAFATAPLLGTGPGTYVAERLTHEVPTTSWYVFPSAHNLVLNTLAETGIVGLMSVLLALALVGPRVARNVSRPGPDRAVAVGALAGLVMLVAHAHVDVVLEVRGLALGAVLVTGLVMCRPDLDVPRGQATTHVTTRAIVLVGLGVGLLSAAPAVRSEFAAAALFRSYAAADAASAMAAARDAAALDPGLVPAHARVGRLALAAGDAPAALAAFDRVVLLEPLAQHLLERAVVRRSLGDADGAWADIERALAADQVDPLILLNAVAWAEGRDSTTIDTPLATLVRRLPALTPLLAGSGVGIDRVALDRSIADAVDAELAADRHGVAVQIAAWAGRPDLLSMAEPRISDPSLRIVIRALVGDEVAARRVIDDPLGAPLGADWPYWAWFLASQRCEEVQAARAASIRMIALRNPPLVPMRVTRGPGDGIDALPAGYPSGIWGVGPDPAAYVPGTWTWEVGTPLCRP